MEVSYRYSYGTQRRNEGCGVPIHRQRTQKNTLGLLRPRTETGDSEEDTRVVEIYYRDRGLGGGRGLLRSSRETGDTDGDTRVFYV